MSDMTNPRSRLVPFFQKHDVEKVTQVDDMLGAWKGREDELFRSLCKKYDNASPNDFAVPKQQLPNHRARLTAFFKRVRPDQVDQVGKVLAMWGGREEQMFAALERQYGKGSTELPDDPAAAATSASHPSNEAVSEIRSKVELFYQQHAPEKISDIDRVLEVYRGRENEILPALEQKYAVQRQQRLESPAAADREARVAAVRAEVEAFYAQHAPEKLSADPSRDDVDAVMQVYAGREEEIIPALHRKYLDPHALKRAELVEFFAKYAPDMEVDVDDLLGKYEGREEDVLPAVRHRFGIPEAATPTAAAAATAASQQSPTTLPSPTAAVAAIDYRAEAEDYLQRNAPHKLSHLDRIVGAFPAGSEYKIIAELERKFKKKHVPKSAALAALMRQQEQQPVTAAPSPPRGEGDDGENDQTEQQQQQPQGETSMMAEHQVRVTDFYQKYAPHKLDDVPKVFATYKGREDEILPALERKYSKRVDEYNAEQSALRVRVENFYRQHKPSKIDDVDKVFLAYQCREGEILSRLHQKYHVPFDSEEEKDNEEGQQASPAPKDPSSVRSEVELFYRQHVPEKCTEPDISKVMRHYKGREEEVIPALEKKYGVTWTYRGQQEGEQQPEQEREQEQSADYSRTPQQPKEEEDAQPQSLPEIRRAVANFYQRHAPEKVTDIDLIFRVYEGREHEILPSLRRKYPSITPTNINSSDDKAAASRGAATQSITDYRSQLAELFKNHAPERLSGVDNTLSLWRGREDEMLRRHEAEFDVSSSPMPPAAIASQGAARARATTTLVPTMGGDGDGDNDAACGHRNISGSGKLTLFVMGARDLQHRNGVYFILFYGGREVFRSIVTADILNPNWSVYDGQCPVYVNGKDYSLTVQFWDKDDASADDFLGECVLNLRSMTQKGEKTYPLAQRSGEGDTKFIRARKDVMGKMNVRWSFVPDTIIPRAGSLPPQQHPPKLFGSGAQLQGSMTSSMTTSPDAALMPLRIRQFYARYLPERVSEVERVCAEHSGKLLQLLDALCLRFGPEPDPTEFRTKIESIFVKYHVKRLRETKAFAKQADGREALTLRSLSNQYGPLPSLNYTVVPSDAAAPNPANCRHRQRLTKWFMLQFPRRVHEVDYFLLRFARREDLLFQLLTETAGPEPKDVPPKDSVRSRMCTTPAIKAYYARRNAPLFLEWMWSGDDNDSSGSNKQNASDHAFPHSDAASPHSAYSSGHGRLVARLERFYNFYNPSKKAEIEAQLQRWKGREDLLFEALVHKYGAEPQPESLRRDEPSSSLLTSSKDGFGRIVPPGVSGSGLTSAGGGGQFSGTPRAILQAFYAVHNPSKLNEVDETLERFSGREEVMWNMLHMKYKVDPMRMPPQLVEEFQGRRGSPQPAPAQSLSQSHQGDASGGGGGGGGEYRPAIVHKPPTG